MSVQETLKSLMQGGKPPSTSSRSYVRDSEGIEWEWNQTKRTQRLWYLSLAWTHCTTEHNSTFVGTATKMKNLNAPFSLSMTSTERPLNVVLLALLSNASLVKFPKRFFKIDKSCRFETKAAISISKGSLHTLLGKHVQLSMWWNQYPPGDFDVDGSFFLHYLTAAALTTWISIPTQPLLEHEGGILTMP